jgi:pimeloyl-ACP methyl ester carboxylesterase
MTDRLLDLTGGVAMVVTDLHGDRDAFDRYFARFRTLYHREEVQRLVLLGDLIHGYGPPAKDRSLEMVLDLMALRDELGPETVIMLLGNHEMPHIYGVSLAKGGQEFTPRFEHALGEHRAAVLDFFASLPFYVRTAAGVMLSHAGPSLESIRHVEALRSFDHRALLAEAEAMLAAQTDLDTFYRQYAAMTGAPYDEEARHFLAISGPDDPRYAHLLRAMIVTQRCQPFQVLWEALFTNNERGLTDPVYLNGCEEFLAAFSVDAPVPQEVIVSGHLVTRGGHMLVNRRHLRLSSATHARPREAGQYLLLNCGCPVDSAVALVPHLGSVFADDAA